MIDTQSFNPFIIIKGIWKKKSFRCTRRVFEIRQIKTNIQNYKQKIGPE